MIPGKGGQDEDCRTPRIIHRPSKRDYYVTLREDGVGAEALFLRVIGGRCVLYDSSCLFRIWSGIVPRVTV